MYFGDWKAEDLNTFTKEIVKDYYDEVVVNGCRYIELNDKYKKMYDNDEVHDNDPDDDDEIDANILLKIKSCEYTIKGKKCTLYTDKPFDE